MYTWCAIFAGYILKLPPGLLNLSYATINLPAYCMEIKFIITGQFDITSSVDEFGPVEIELLISSVFLGCAIFGREGLESPVPYLPEYILYKHLFAAFFAFLQLIFALDNIVDSLKANAKRTLYFLITPAIIILNCSLCGYFQTDTYTTQFVLFHLLHSLCFNISYYRLMLSNMTKSEFKILGLENFIAALPLLTHLSVGNKVERMVFEPLASYLSIAILYLLFYIHIGLLSNQYLQNNPK